MAVDFPNSPSVNDEFTSGTRTWIWDGSVWLLKGVAISLDVLSDVTLTTPASGETLIYDGSDWVNSELGGSLEVSDTAPSSPSVGDLWFDSTSGNTYVYFDSFWVEAIGSDGITSGGSLYTNSDVDTHLNTSTASSGEVLSWTGSDYDWVAQSSGASLPNSQYIDYQNTSDFAVNVPDLAPLKYSDGTTDLVGQVTVSSGYTRALIELHGNIQAITANDEEAYLMVQRSTDGGSSWTNVKNIQVSALEVDWNNNLNSVYQPFARKVLDTHGVSAGGTVQYRFINNTAGVVGGSANSIRQFFTDVSSVLIVQEVA